APALSSSRFPESWTTRWRRSTLRERSTMLPFAPVFAVGRTARAACYSKTVSRRDGRVVEGARLESVYRGNSIQGSNPCLSAIIKSIGYNDLRVGFGQFWVMPVVASVRVNMALMNLYRRHGSHCLGRRALHEMS